MATNINTLQSTVYDTNTGLATKASQSALQSEATTRASADSAMATSITTLQSTVNNPTTGLSSKASAEDLTEVSTTLDSVRAQRTLKVAAQDSNGRYVLS